MSKPKQSSTAPKANLPPPALNRLTRELSLLSRDPPPGVAAYVPNDADASTLRAQITGPPSTPFETGIFLVTIHITPRYPFEPPRVRFVTPVYHPNIDSAGRICLDTLKSPPAGSWSPAVSLPSLLTTLRTLLAEPNPDDALVAEIAEEYKRQPDRWARVAREWTAREASGERLAAVEGALDGNGGNGDNGGKAKEAGDRDGEGRARGDAEEEKKDDGGGGRSGGDDDVRGDEKMTEETTAGGGSDDGGDADASTEPEPEHERAVRAKGKEAREWAAAEEGQEEKEGKRRKVGEGEKSESIDATSSAVLEQ